MEIDVVELFNDELMMLNWLVDVFEIPDDVFREHGASAITMLLWDDDNKLRDEIFDAGKEMALPDIAGLLERGQAGFECLCQSVPHIPRDAVKALSLAYGTYVLITKDYRDGIRNEFDQSDLRTLFAVTMVRGQAMGLVGMAGGKMLVIRDEVLRKKLLSEAGAKGGAIRREKLDPLRQWGLEKSKGMRGSDAEISRKLHPLIPPNLAGLSNDPQRVIYKALLERKSLPTLPEAGLG